MLAVTDTAADRERERLAEVRRRRAARDEARRQEALREADQLQRMPLLITMSTLLHQRVRQLHLQTQHQAAAARDELLWSQTGLSVSAAARWRSSGWDATAVLVALRALDRADEQTTFTLWSDRSALHPDVVERCLPDLVNALPPLEGAELLADVTAAPTLQLPEESEQLLLCLVADEPPPLRSYADEPVAIWALAHHVRAGRPLTRLGVRPGALPLPLVETLLASSPQLLLDDLCGSESDAGLRRYVLARTRPDELSDSDVAEMPWRYEAARRALLSGGDDAQLEDVPFLSSCGRLYAGRGTRDDLALVHAETPTSLTAALLALHDDGSVTAGMTEDPTCWRHVAQVLRQQGRSGEVGDDALGRWLALDMLRLAVLERRTAAGLAAAKQLAAVQKGDQRIAAELHTAKALLHGFAGDRARSLQAFDRACKAANNDITKKNRELAGHAADPARLSAYVVLGVAHGDPAWSTAADALHARLWLDDPQDLMTEVNWAADSLESGADEQHWVTWPIRPALYEPVPTSAGVFRPPAAAHPPAAAPLNDASLLALRERAAAAVTRHVLSTISYERAS